LGDLVRIFERDERALKTFRFVFLGLMIVAFGLFSSRFAIAQPTAMKRVAVIVGANDPPPGRQGLRFAHDDANEMASVLEQVGGFAPGDVTVLLDPHPTDLMAAFDAVAKTVASAQGNALFVFYYSPAPGEERGGGVMASVTRCHRPHPRCGRPLRRGSVARPAGARARLSVLLYPAFSAKPDTIVFAIVSCFLGGMRTNTRSPRSVINLVGVPGGRALAYARIVGCSFKRSMSCVTRARVNPKRRARSARFVASPASRSPWNRSAIARSATTFGRRKSRFFLRFSRSGRKAMILASLFSHAATLGSHLFGRRT
jgi:hypothetical protein